MNARTIVTRRVVCLAALCVSLVVAPVVGQGGPPPGGQAAPPAQDEAALVAKAKGIHQRVITLDTHNDISPNNFTPECNYTMRLTTQVNLPKMVEGGMDVSFMIAYVGQGPLTPEGYDNAYRQAIAKFEAVNRLTEQIAPTQIGLALTADDVVRLHNQGKKIAVIGIENGYPIGMDINRVKEFWQKGGRYMSLAHNGHSQLADSNTGEANNEWMWGGLSPLGKQVIAEMNKWGIMVDVSHPSKGSMMQAVALSKAPIIASHSAIRALADVSRNLDDEQLIAIKQNGGVVQVVAFASYVKADPPGRAAARAAAMAQLREQFGIAVAAGEPPRLAPLGEPAVAGEAAAVAEGVRLARRLPAAHPRRRPARRTTRSSGPRWTRSAADEARRATRASTRSRRSSATQYDAEAREDQRGLSAGAARDGQGLRRSHRLRGQAHRHRPRRHLVGLRRWRRCRRLEQRGRGVQRHARARASRLHRGTNRQDLEWQLAARVARDGTDREEDSVGRDQIEKERRSPVRTPRRTFQPTTLGR